VLGLDVSAEALGVAQGNVARLAPRVVLLRCHLLSALRGPVDLLAANLPYLTDAELAALAPEVRHDPKLALAGGTDGLDLIRELVAAAPGVLAPGGLLALEIGARQGDVAQALLASQGFRRIAQNYDLAGLPRVVSAMWGPLESEVSPAWRDRAT
jgi:release factor glutamine methyltransferase